MTTPYFTYFENLKRFTPNIGHVLPILDQMGVTCLLNGRARDGHGPLAERFSRMENDYFSLRNHEIFGACREWSKVSGHKLCSKTIGNRQPAIGSRQSAVR